MSSFFVRFLTVLLSTTFLTTPKLLAAPNDTSAFEEFTNSMFGLIVDSYSPFLFWQVPLIKMPLIVFIMLCGGIFFTFRFGFINLRYFKHAFDIAFGRYDNKDAKDKDGEVSHFQALTAALSATVGLGNIAGVAVAISQGGPGAVFWMWVTAFFGMSLKFSSCTLAIMYRTVGTQGKVLGGPMVYLSQGLKEIGREKLGKFFGGLFAVCAIMSSFGGGNLFQSNQTYAIISTNFPNIHPLVVGVTLSFFAAIVLVGGIRRIGEVTSRLVPFMCGFYVLSCLFIIFANYHQVPLMFADIFRSAYSPDAVYGGFLGVLVIGITRASFSSEAGLGSAAIAHSAAKTKEPVREGLVGMIEPFIDTHMVCTMTALAILITNSHVGLEVGTGGVEITGAAFASIHPVMPILLMLAIIIFAYSTVISWSYYGERATEYLFGQSLGPIAIKMYRTVYVFVIILGPLLTLGNVVDFADLMLLSMAFPNILGMVLLSKVTKKKVVEYQQKLKSGEFPLSQKS